MASSMEFIELKEKVENFKGLTFELQVKTALKWSTTEWESFGFKGTKFQRLINSATHWKNKLSEAFTQENVILMLYNEASPTVLNANDIVDAIEALYPGIKVLSYNRFRNPRYLGVDLANKQMKDYVLKNLKTVGQDSVLFLSWAPAVSEHTIRVHWIPKEVGEEKIAVVINKYFVARFLKFETTRHRNGKDYGCGVMVYCGKLREGVTLDSVPHICYIGKLESLWTIGSRDPLCLQCNIIGHKSFECKLFYCKVCKSKKLKDHECRANCDVISSYAEAVKMKNVNSDSEEEELFNDELDIVSEEEFNKIKQSVDTYKENTEKLQGKSSKNFEVEKQPLIKKLEVSQDPILFSEEENLEPFIEENQDSVTQHYTEVGNENLKIRAHDNSEIILGIISGTKKKKVNKPKETKIPKEKMLALASSINTYSKMTTRGSNRGENLFDALEDQGGGGEN